MEDRAHGIILRTRPLTETSLIVQWLTADSGRIATVAKGARRPKSAFMGKLDLYYEADFTFQRARKSSLHTLREVSVRATRASLRTELSALDHAARAGRRIEKTTEEETPLPEVFELFRNFLDELSTAEPALTLLLAFEIKLLDLLGLRPELKGMSPGSARSIELLSASDFQAARRLKLSPSQATELEAFLERCFREGMQ